MSDKYFLDTNVLVYAFDKEDAGKQAIARQYLNYIFTAQNYHISLQVINEFCNVVLRKLKPAMSREELHAFISLIPEQCIVSLTRAITLKALQVRHDYHLSFWDSMIIAAAVIHQCDYVVTEDLSDTQKIESVTIMNPFVEGKL